LKLDARLQRLWYQGWPIWLLALLLPLSLVFAACVRLRRALYRVGLLNAIRVGRPVIVVGNVTVGGTGKTPFVIWLAGLLQQRGRRVGIVLRGYGGTSKHWPREVLPQTDHREVGDEAVLLATRTGAIVVVAPDRVAAAKRAIELGAELILADDGLQHYRLARDCEIAVVDERRAFGNGQLLPAGPLREPVSRLRSVNLIVRTRRAATNTLTLPSVVAPQIAVAAHLGTVVALAGGEARSIESFRSGPVHAIAGIGYPEAFFAALEYAGLQVKRHPLPDHAVIGGQEIDFADGLPVLMTQKDAVKCRGLAAEPRYAIAAERCWVVGLDLDVTAADTAAVAALIDGVLGSSQPKQ
jgi:tetraacyldisaccharide 4'-kinase